ncbi:MAG: hypothetical protein R3D05_00840 [Dongiaceae bacterium]
MRSALAEVLRTMSGRLVSEDGLTLHLMGKGADELKTLLATEIRRQMRDMVQSFLSEIEMAAPQSLD